MENITANEFFESFDELGTKKKRKTADLKNDLGSAANADTEPDVKKAKKKKKAFESEMTTVKTKKKRKHMTAPHDNTNTGLREDKKSSVAELVEDDPEFRKFLEEEEPEMLEEVVENVSDEDEPKTQRRTKPDEEKMIPKTEYVERQVEKICHHFEREAGPSITSCRALIKYFHTIIRANCNPDSKEIYPEEMESTILELVVNKLRPALRKVLKTNKADKNGKMYTSLKDWNKIEQFIYNHLRTCEMILAASNDDVVIYSILKHLMAMSKYAECFPAIMSKMVVQCSSLWSKSPVLNIQLTSFLLIERFVKANHALWKVATTKCLTRYSKKTDKATGSALTNFQFMQQSMVQLLTLDLQGAYKQAIPSIQEMVSLLRNALTKPTKESLSAVIQWRTVHILSLWASFVSSLKNPTLVEPLVYPLTEVIIGLLQIAKTARLYPFRFHLIDLLIKIARGTGKFIPIVNHILEVFSITDFNAKPSKMSVRPFNIHNTVKFSEADIKEKGFYDCVIKRIHRTLLETADVYSHRIASPEVFLLPCVHLRKFISKCTNNVYKREMKTLVDKLEENNQFVVNKREQVTFTVADQDQIEKFENDIVESGGTPINKYAQHIREIDLKNQKALELIDMQEMKKSKKGKKWKVPQKDSDDENGPGFAQDDGYDKELEAMEEDGFEDDAEVDEILMEPGNDDDDDAFEDLLPGEDES